MRSSPPSSKTNTTISRTRPDWSTPTTSHRLGSSSSSRGREFKACSYAYRIASSQRRSRPKCLRALACTLGDMTPLAHSRANRVRTAPNPLQGSTFHQRRQCLCVQTHRHSDARPLPHRRTPRARSRQLSQVIPTLGLISPRLNLLISHRDPTKKTLTHSEYRIRNSPATPRLRRRRRHQQSSTDNKPLPAHTPGPPSTPSQRRTPPLRVTRAWT